MYLYLGQATVINTRDVIGIFDLDNTSTSRLTRQFLKHAQTTGGIVEVSADIPKSFVLCREKDVTKVYLSQIAPATLKKRTGFLKELAAQEAAGGEPL